MIRRESTPTVEDVHDTLPEPDNSTLDSELPWFISSTANHYSEPKKFMRIHAKGIDNTLREVVWQAVEQGRVTCGVQNCAHQLETEPCNILLCVLPEATPDKMDVSTSIHHMLIEAFCLENSVQLIKVDSVGKLERLLQGRAPSAFKSKTFDLSCVLVQYPTGAASIEDRTLAEFCRSDVFKDTSQFHHIALPD
ncbi:growth arrest and DNA damage-inducible protein gadd45 alpha-like [Plakobranchus ocellatus]|uniref:Growth arrest and DNA damage-inducible protein gadd45 alpha-like n=1 Tax=Plakobranchus ocellatus TaxID=259542 RepID=A0AAV4BHR8_9GAST|nr:growth arrest and DNA damage-inducible protein gadd45 alpha-like [Plakobranchus ocellatus]